MENINKKQRSTQFHTKEIQGTTGMVEDFWRKE